MKGRKIIKLIDSKEPIAIVRYFEWAISPDYARPKYLLLRIDREYNIVHKVNVPDYIVPFIVSRLDEFKKVVKEDYGTVWERMSFKDKVKSLDVE